MCNIERFCSRQQPQERTSSSPTAWVAACVLKVERRFPAHLFRDLGDTLPRSSMCHSE
jgi:hypothetical protein